MQPNAVAVQNQQQTPVTQPQITKPRPLSKELSTVIAMRRFVDEQSQMASMRQFVDEKSQLAMMRSSQLIERADVGDLQRPAPRLDSVKYAKPTKSKALPQVVAKAQQPASPKKVHQFTAIVRGVIQSKRGQHHILQTAEVGRASGKLSPNHHISTTKISHSTGTTTPQKMVKPKVLIAALPRKVAAPRIHKLTGTRVAKQTRSKRNQQYIAYQRNLKHSSQKPRYVAKSGEKEGRMVARTFKKWGSKFVHVYKGLKGLFASL